MIDVVVGGDKGGSGLWLADGSLKCCKVKGEMEGRG